MTKGFNEIEKEKIRNALMEKGKELFGRYGLKKTSVEDLTKAVGIAQGSFYLFFSSKEELCFEIIGAEQEAFHKAADALLDSGSFTKDAFKRLIKDAFAFVASNPAISNLFTSGEYEKMVRKLPAEKVNEHLNSDLSRFLPLIIQLQGEGKMIKADPKIILGVFRALFALPLFKKEIGEDICPEVLDLMLNVVADGIVRNEGNKNDWND